MFFRPEALVHTGTPHRWISATIRCSPGISINAQPTAGAIGWGTIVLSHNRGPNSELPSSRHRLRSSSRTTSHHEIMQRHVYLIILGPSDLGTDGLVGICHFSHNRTRRIETVSRQDSARTNNCDADRRHVPTALPNNSSSPSFYPDVRAMTGNDRHFSNLRCLNPCPAASACAASVFFPTEIADRTKRTSRTPEFNVEAMGISS